MFVASALAMNKTFKSTLEIQINRFNGLNWAPHGATLPPLSHRCLPMSFGRMCCKIRLRRYRLSAAVGQGGLLLSWIQSCTNFHPHSSQLSVQYSDCPKLLPQMNLFNFTLKGSTVRARLRLSRIGASNQHLPSKFNNLRRSGVCTKSKAQHRFVK